MSDLMMLGILRMPFGMVRDDQLALLQFVSAAHRAADRIESDAVALEAANARIAELEQELRNIANADTVAWDDPTEFEAWAKSRARHTLGKT